MDAATGNADAVNPSTPGGVAQRQLRRTSAVGSPVRRSPRLSRLLPPIESQGTRNLEERSGDESESVDDVALHLSRDETPDNDDLPLDEPSTVLANRIIRAHDNPSPPPLDLAQPDIDYVPGKAGQFPHPGVSIPPSPFRPINFLERLNPLALPLLDPPHNLRIPTLDARPDVSDLGVVPPCDFVSLEPPLQSIMSVPTKSTLREDLASTGAIRLSSEQCPVDDFPLQSSPHVCELVNIVTDAVIDSSSPPIVGLHGQSTAMSNPLESKTLISSPSQTIDSSSAHAEPLFSPLANGSIESSTDTKKPSRGAQDNHEEMLSVDNKSRPNLDGERESENRATDGNLLQRPSSPSSHPTIVFAKMCLVPAPHSPIGKANLSAESTRNTPQSTTPPRTPPLSVTHLDFSRTSVRRPVIAPTPVRTNSAWKSNSPTKFLLEANNVHRTPAQRVPIETALVRGTSSFQRTVRLSTRLDQSQPGCNLTIRAPVFTRPALDDPSRTPAKRIPVVDLVTSPTKEYQAPNTPTRLGLRTRSASVEPRPLGNILARSRSVEPCATNLKPDDHTKIKESIFPMVPILPRAGTKLPFPLVSGQKPTSDLPSSIVEEHENTETGNFESEATSGGLMQGNTTSQLRQPPINSRIPRIGNKPYARPPKTGKATATKTTVNTTRASNGPSFKLAFKAEVGNDNTEVTSTQPTNDQRLAGALKRKRDAEATAPLNSHPIMIRQVVPGILSRKYAPKPVKYPSPVLAPLESSPPKVSQPMKFRKVVDGMLSARYPPAKAKCAQTELSDSASPPPSPLSELSSSSNEEPLDEKLPAIIHSPTRPKSEMPDGPQTDPTVLESSSHEHSSSHQDANSNRSTTRPRRTSRTRKPAQQQYVLDVFNNGTSMRPPPARRKPQSRTEGDRFMGMSATALKALTSFNTTKNQQTVAVLAMEVIRKDGLRPESPSVKARTILQKQRDERDTRRREREQRRAQMTEESKETEERTGLDGCVSLGARAGHDENDCDVPRKHRLGPGDEEDYETPERPERTIEPLRLQGMDGTIKPVKQVKWHRGLSTAAYLDEIDPKPKCSPKNVVVRGCLAPTSKNLPLDSLGNLVDLDGRPTPELVTEHIVVKRYLYDNDIEPELTPAKVTRSKSKKSRS